MYRGRAVVDVKSANERALKRKQEKLKALGQSASQAAKDTEGKE